MTRTRRFLTTLCLACALALLAACGRSAPPFGAPAPQQPTAAPSVTGVPAATATATAATAAASANVPPQAEAAAATPAGAAGTPVGLAGRRATPVVSAAVLLPTVTPKPAEQAAALLPTRTPTRAPDPAPLARVATTINVRSGPGTAYPVIGGLEAGSAVPIVGRNAAADWWKVDLPDATTGWLYAPLAEATGDTATVALAANIPAPPTAVLPAAVLPAAVLPTNAPPADTPTPPPAAPATEAPAAPTTAASMPPVAQEPPATGPDFRVVEKRLWDVTENGGFLVGDSVHCGEKRQLVVNVLDANGSRVNGVAVQVEYGARETIVTGSQGRGDGVAEFVLGGGQDVKVVRDSDGRAVTSEMATGLSTNPAAIPFEHLIAAQYCTDEESCRRFVDAPGCFGHYSWTVTFQRSY